MDNRYSFNIEWSEEDQEYIATCPAFAGLSAFGATEEEALKEAKIALQGFIKTCRAQGIPLPEPRVRETHSGQFRVRLPKTLHRQAAQLAASDGISLNQLVVGAIEQRVGFKQAETQILAEINRWRQVVVASAITANERVTTSETIDEVSPYTRTGTLVVESGERGH
jgi:predicted HicB family RNase H-like nuclease